MTPNVIYIHAGGVAGAGAGIAGADGYSTSVGEYSAHAPAVYAVPMADPAGVYSSELTTAAASAGGGGRLPSHNDYSGYETTAGVAAAAAAAGSSGGGGGSGTVYAVPIERFVDGEDESGAHYYDAYSVTGMRDRTNTFC
eukprot:gene22859-31943_t